MKNTSNTTQRPYRFVFELEEDYLWDEYAVSNLTISILVLIINLCVILLYAWQRRKLLIKPCNYLVLSLLMVEFLSGISGVLNVVIYAFPMYKYGSEFALRNFRIAVDIYTVFLVKNNVMHLCGLTIDRFVSIFAALKYKTYVTFVSVRYFISAAWVVPFIVSTTQLAWLHLVITEEETELVDKIEIWYSVVSFTIFLAVPMLALGVAFIMMFSEIRRILLYKTPNHHMVRSAAKQRRIIFVFGSMYLTFLVLAMPYFCFRLWVDINAWKGREIAFNYGFLQLVTTLKNMTLIINPLLYTTFSPDFRAVFKKSKASCGGSGSGGGGGKNRNGVVRKTPKLSKSAKSGTGKLQQSHLLANPATV